jgi:hypothetical protein
LRCGEGHGQESESDDLSMHKSNIEIDKIKSRENLRISFLLVWSLVLLFWRELRELCEDVSDTDSLLYFSSAFKRWALHLQTLLFVSSWKRHIINGDERKEKLAEKSTGVFPLTNFGICNRNKTVLTFF